MEKVILVDKLDKEIGTMEKQEAHIKGVLHRAFSIFVFNSKKELLLQRRAKTKYHSAGLWTNTCCSHPRPNESTKQAAKRRLKEEMGMSCNLSKQFDFIYKAILTNGLYEHEFDHVYFGTSNDPPTINLSEVDTYEYKTLEVIKKEIKNIPERYTEWFKICFVHVEKFYNKNL
jgi:isopentenyl-diphosphate delta-isomerase